ncbi:pseudouridine synthase [Salinicoccus sp. HZC-1]|uniref:pseudouridine synthase n=1 Tax=Salinicoccus sp. HZC-1 TaxID=3385497 RepID=UPI00398AF7B2
MRLDKYLSNAGEGSRKDVKSIMKKGRVTVGQKVIKDPKFEVDGSEEIRLDDKKVVLENGIYIMLNKPKGVISSTEEGPTRTVIDLIDHPQSKDLFPVGRLDKDTTGLLFITDDGKLAHELLSPRNRIDKTYIADLKDDVSESDISMLEQGIPLKDFTTASAVAVKISSRKVKLTITEGKFHQVKRMFQYLGNEVVDLERIEFASLGLDDGLRRGEYRRLTESEIDILKK